MQRCDSVIVCFPLSFLFSSRKGYFLAAAAAVVYYRSKLLSARLITIADLLIYCCRHFKLRGLWLPCDDVFSSSSSVYSLSASSADESSRLLRSLSFERGSPSRPRCRISSSDMFCSSSFLPFPLLWTTLIVNGTSPLTLR